MSFLGGLYPEGPCSKCGSLIDVESFDYNESGGRSAMFCFYCWQEESETETSNQKVVDALKSYFDNPKKKIKRSAYKHPRPKPKKGKA